MTTPTSPPTFVATPVPHTAAELEAVTYNADGLVGAIVQDAVRRRRADVRLDERRVAGPDARDRAHLVLEPEPPGVLVQGRDLRRPPVRARVSATTATATPCWSPSTRRAPGPATPATAPASTGPSATTPAADLGQFVTDPAGPGVEGFRTLARAHRIVPVWRELVADTVTPVAAFLQSSGPATPAASCSSRWRAANVGAGTPSSAATRWPPWSPRATRSPPGGRSTSTA